MKKTALLLSTLLALVSTSGCYTTHIATGATPMAGPGYEERQWFTIGGFVPLSSPAGRECPNGLATADSRLAASDVLINVGLAVAGNLIGSAACASSEDPAVRASCASAGSTLVPFLLGTRTVSYTCAAAPPPALAR